MDTRHRRTGLLIATMLALVATGTRPAIEASAENKTNKNKKAATAPQLTWPLPPEQPRIRYLTSYRGVGDFKAKKQLKWKSMLLGEDAEGEQPSDTMVKPYGIAVGPNGRIYVADTAARRVFALDPDARTVSFVGENGSTRLTKPIGVAVDAKGQVFVADATLNRVFGFRPDGSLALAIGHDGEFQSPSGLAVDPERKRLYVADAGKHHIVCYSTDDGSLIQTIGKRGGEPGEFNFPTNLFVDRLGRLYVADTMNFRIQVLDADGTAVSAFGTQGDTAGTFNRPKGVGVDSDGNIYVADASFNNFQIFDGEGRLLLFVGTGGPGPGEFLLPAGMYIDANDRIYVADQGNSRVQVFQLIRPGARSLVAGNQSVKP